MNETDEDIIMVSRSLLHRTLIGAFLIFNTSNCFAEDPGLMRCSDNVCEWSLISNKRLISREKNVNLIEAQIARGYSFHMSGSTPSVEENKDAYKHIRIKWNKGDPEKVTVFCYGRLPVYGTGGKWFVLPFDSQYPAFYQVMSDFVHICYGAQRNAWQDGVFLSKNQLTMPLRSQVSVQDPRELFKYVK